VGVWWQKDLQPHPKQFFPHCFPPLAFQLLKGLGHAILSYFNFANYELEMSNWQTMSLSFAKS